MQPNKEKLWVDEHCSNSKRTLCCMEGQTRVGVASVFTPPKDIIGWHGPGHHILAFCRQDSGVVQLCAFLFHDAFYLHVIYPLWSLCAIMHWLVVPIRVFKHNSIKLTKIIVVVLIKYSVLRNCARASLDPCMRTCCTTDNQVYLWYMIFWLVKNNT
jgi:hypothetical protein